MFVELDIENISLVIQNEDEYGTPLSRLTFNKMSLNMKQKEFDMDVEINIENLDGSYYYL